MSAYALRDSSVLHGSIQGAAEDFSLGDRLTTWVRVLSSRRRQRLALANLDARLLSDVGIDQAQARQEYEKPIWHS